MQKRFLFIGIGGMGMGPLALYLRQQGNIIYGYDDMLSEKMEYFFEKQEIVNCVVFPEIVDIVVYSSAISQEHPWVIEAKGRNLKTIRRGEMLATFCNEKKIIAVTGSHGKTMTTGMLTDFLPKCSYILGGFFDSEKLPAKYSDSNDYLICEVDESDRTIENFSPYITLVINLENDHLSNYGSEEKLNFTFKRLFEKTEKFIVFPPNNSRLTSIAKSAKISAQMTANTVENCDVTGLKENRFVVEEVLKFLRINDKNLLINDVKLHTPVARRNQYLGNLKEIDLWADYAHHPTEILECIKHFEQKYSSIIFVFQPHRYTRTKQYAKDFAECFKDKITYFLPVYAASEKFLEGGESEDIVRYLSGNCKAIKDLSAFEYEEYVKIFTEGKSKDSKKAIIFIGAGSILSLAKQWIENRKFSFVKQFLESENISFKENYPAKPYNTLRISDTFLLIIEPDTIEKLQSIISVFCKENLPYCVIGNGSNLLIDTVKCAFIDLKNLPKIFKINDNEIVASSNILLSFFCKKVAECEFSGCEKLSGIPGTLGGALCMNAGAYDQSISDCLVEVELLDKSGQIIFVSKKNIDFNYRKGIKSGVVLSAKFSFKTKNSIENLTQEFKRQFELRKEKQPQEPNAGSVFKNPQNMSAGSLIDKCMLKGSKRNDAEISAKHANFIVNIGNANAKDVKYLLKLCRQKVFESNEIFLEREIIFASDLI